MPVTILASEFEPVRVAFHGWREQVQTARKIRVSEHDGEFPSANDIGISARLAGKQKNWPYINAKAFYSIILSALLREPDGSEYRFTKPGTKTVEIIVPIERDGELPKGCGFILVEGMMVWPTLQPRDQNNYSTISWKFWGDVLEQDGYLAAHDDWFAYQGGNITRGLHRGKPAYCEFVFFPSRTRLEPVDLAAPAESLFG